jgi:hypothetical protein
MIYERLEKYEDALEYYYYNIVGGHFGDRNPLFLL